MSEFQPSFEGGNLDAINKIPTLDANSLRFARNIVAIIQQQEYHQAKERLDELVNVSQDQTLPMEERVQAAREIEAIMKDIDAKTEVLDEVNSKLDID